MVASAQPAQASPDPTKQVPDRGPTAARIAASVPTGIATTSVVAAATAARSNIDGHRDLFADRTRHANRAGVRNFLANPTAHVDRLHFRHLTADDAGDLAGPLFANPLGHAVRDLLAALFAFPADGANRNLLGVAFPSGRADRDLLRASLAFPPSHAVRNLLGALFAHPASHAALHFFGARLAHGTAASVRNLFADALAANPRAGDFFGFASRHPDATANRPLGQLAANHLRAARIAAVTGRAVAAIIATAIVAAAVATTTTVVVSAQPRQQTTEPAEQAAVAVAANPLIHGAARNRFGHGFPVPTADRDGLGVGFRDPHQLGNRAILGFRDFAVVIDRDGLGLHFLHRLPNRVVHGAVAGFFHRLADRVIHGLVAHFPDRLAAGHGLVRRFPNRATHGVVDGLVARLLHRTTDRIRFGFAHRFTNRPSARNFLLLGHGANAVAITSDFLSVIDNASACSHDCVRTATSTARGVVRDNALAVVAGPATTLGPAGADRQGNRCHCQHIQNHFHCNISQTKSDVLTTEGGIWSGEPLAMPAPFRRMVFAEFGPCPRALGLVNSSE